MLHEAPSTPAVLPSTASFPSPWQGGGREGEGGRRARDAPTMLGQGNGRDEETKMEKEGEEVPFVYAVTVHDDDDARK